MRHSEPQANVINAIDVPSVGDFSKRIVANGGKVVLPKMPVPGVGYVAYCQDTEGNTFSILQSDMTAK